MAGVEVIAVLGIASSVIQVVDCGKRVLDRISEFRRNMAFQDIALQIPLLINDVKTLNSPHYRQLLDTATEQALIRVLEGCLRQLNALDSLIQGMKPEKTASMLFRTWRGVRSFGKDTKLREIMGKLAEYKSTITLHFSARHVQTLKKPNVLDGKTKSFFEVPIQRVSHFVGRVQILDSVNNAIAASTSNPAAVVLTGVGGQGKTQVALEFCQRYAETYRAIFWVDASSEASTTRSFERIAVTLSTVNQVFPDPQAKIAFVKETLRTWPDPWMLVFDNYDTPRTFDNIMSFFPTSHAKEKNVILVTSRIATSGRLGTPIRMNGLTEDEALELLFLRSQLIEKRHGDRPEGKRIVKKLGYLPLAIDQAAAYISIRQLPLNLFMQHYEKRKEVILKHTPDSAWVYRTHADDTEKASAMNLSVFTTWDLSFEHIAEDEGERKSIGEFLTQVAFFDPTGISESLFTSFLQSFTTTNGEPPSWIKPFLRSNAWDSSQFQDVVIGLMNLSLIQSVEYVGHELKFSMHPLIKDWLQLRKASNQQQRVHTAINIIAYWIMDRDVETLPLPSRQEILGHIDSCGDNSSHYLTTNDSVLLHGGFVDGSQTSFATFYGRHDRYDDAEKLFLRSLELQNQEFGLLNAGTLRTMNNLSAMYLNMGRLNEAAAMLQQTLDARLKVLGPNDPLTLDTVNNMGNLYVMRAMFTQASEMYTRALQGYIDIYGHGHRSVVEALNNLGEVSMKTGDLDDAEHRFTAALGTASKTASDGSNNFTSDGNALVLYIKSNIAVIYALQGRSSEAIEVYMQVISGRERLLGPGHSLTLMSMCELADIYRDRGQTDEAELWYARGKATMHRRQERPLEYEQEKGNDPPAGSSRTTSQPTFSSTAATHDLPPEAQPPRLADGIMGDQPREAIAISGSSNQEAELEGRNSVLNGINSHSTDIEPHHGQRSHVGATSNNAWDDQWVAGSRKIDDPEELLCKVGDSDDWSTIMDSWGLENLLKTDEKPSQATEKRKESLESAILHDRDAISGMPRPNGSKDLRLHEEDQLREKMKDQRRKEMEKMMKREEQLREEMMAQRQKEMERRREWEKQLREKREEQRRRDVKKMKERDEQLWKEMNEEEERYYHDRRRINVRRYGINKEHDCTVM